MGYMIFHFGWALSLTLILILLFPFLWMLPIICLYSFFGVPVSDGIYCRAWVYAQLLQENKVKVQGCEQKDTTEEQ